MVAPLIRLAAGGAITIATVGGPGIGLPSPAQHPEPPRSATPVAAYWRTLNSGWPAGVVFGITGLLLAPIGGIWLRHRQARATKAAPQLVRS